MSSPPLATTSESSATTNKLSRKSPPVDPYEHAITEARKEGLFAGLAAALASGVIGARFMSFGRNKTIACGVVTGLLSGYLFTEAFTQTGLAQARHQLALQKEKDAPESMTTPAKPTSSL